MLSDVNSIERHGTRKGTIIVNGFKEVNNISKIDSVEMQ